ncbi:Flp pilus assembly protein CpaB [Paenibacillus massiliensis]|uniref:Flp pilus assembly protein CpaB n=1 Tax=Paenibacillus massiliensis TaxID=225917 RepID=UPI000374C9BA|nr:Flp pilus assembly protein CpaB [Paenibacillus massiliensis]
MKSWFRNRTIVGIVCIVFSLILTLGIAPLLNQASNEQIAIVRLAKDVPKGAIITADQIESVQVGAYHLPQEVLTSSQAVIGQYAAVDLKRNDYILPSKLSNTPLDAYLSRLDGNKQAISVTIKSLAAGLSGKLQPGDIVTIIASDYGELRTTTLLPELQYVEVLAATTSSGHDAQQNNQPDQEQDEQALPSTLTMLVTPEQAKLLADLEKKSKLHAALVYRGDANTAKAFTDQQDAYFASKMTQKEEGAHEQ